jgi:uncharacterized protein YkwD
MKSIFKVFLLWILASLPFSCSQKETCPSSSAPKDVKVTSLNGSFSVEVQNPSDRIYVKLNNQIRVATGKKIIVNDLENGKIYDFQVGTSFSCNGDTLWAKETFTAIPSTLDKQAMLKEVNRWRRTGCRCGDVNMPPVDSLIWNEKLERAALTHSKDMAKTKFMSHTGSDGSTLSTRVNRVGYVWSSLGENVAYNYSAENVIPNGWIKSPGHCRNIMSEEFKDMGMAVAFSQDGTPYYTQVFGRQR